MTEYQFSRTRRLRRGEEGELLTQDVKMFSWVSVTARERKSPRAAVLKDLRQGLNMAGVHFFFFFLFCHVLLNLFPHRIIPCVEMTGRQD